MVDFHSHILPSIDDGSKTIEESMALLKLLVEQEVKTVVASSHFYADFESPESFLERRNKAYNELSLCLSSDFPNILLGAEVRFYSGISRMKELSSLCVEGTKLLLLEMPFSRWTEYTVNELVELSCSNEIKIVLAHIERYLHMQEFGLLERLREQGILVQVNASFFESMLSRRKAFKMLKNGYIDFIGSDCHNIKHRPPTVNVSREAIAKKFGVDFLNDFIEYSNNLLAKYRV